MTTDQERIDEERAYQGATTEDQMNEKADQLVDDVINDAKEATEGEKETTEEKELSLSENDDIMDDIKLANEVLADFDKWRKEVDHWALLESMGAMFNDQAGKKALKIKLATGQFTDDDSRAITTEFVEKAFFIGHFFGVNHLMPKACNHGRNDDDVASDLDDMITSVLGRMIGVDLKGIGVTVEKVKSTDDLLGALRGMLGLDDEVSTDAENEVAEAFKAAQKADYDKAGEKAADDVECKGAGMDPEKGDTAGTARSEAHE